MAGSYGFSRFSLKKIFSRKRRAFILVFLFSLCSWAESGRQRDIVINWRSPRSPLRPVRVSYFDIEKANKTCQPKDSCAHSRNDRNGGLMNDWKRRNCFCDQQCIVFEDCCVDSPFRRDPNVNYKKNEAFQCISVRQFGSLYMRTKCPSTWNDEKIRKNCEDTPTSPFDPISTLPITNMRTGFTYRNYACALCNNQTFTDRMELWRPRLECPSLSRKDGANLIGNNSSEEDLNSVMAEQLEYRTEEGSWGFRVNTPSGEQSWSACTIDPVVPPDTEHLIRACLPSIKECPLGYNNTEVHRKCLSYTATVYHLGEGYRNVHCGICNGISPENLQCEKIVYSRNGFSFEFNNAVFSVLFDLGPRDGTLVGRVKRCSRQEIFDPFFGKCRSVLCLPGQVYSEGRCLPDPSSPLGSSEKPFDIITANELGEGLDQSQANTVLSKARRPPSRDFDKCPKVILLNSEYTVLPNGSVHVAPYDLILARVDYAVQSQERLVICAPPAQAYTDKFGPVLGFISFAGVLVSALCLILHLLATSAAPELRNLSGKNLGSLSVALLLVYAVFLALPFIRVPSNTCTVLAVILYYSLMASFCWMLVLSWDVSTTLRKATQELRISTGSQWTRFFFYSIFGWLFPALLVSMAVVAELLPVEVMPWPYSPSFGRHNCWFGQKPALLIYFAGPVAFILVLNIIMFIDAARVIATTSKGTAKAKACASPHKNFKLYLRLSILMGLSWILGIIAGVVDIPVLWIIFILANTLQGLFIFVCFTCSGRVRRSLGARLCGTSPNPSWTWSGHNGHMIRTTSSASSHTKRSDLDPGPDPLTPHCRHSHSHQQRAPVNAPLGKIYRSPSSELYRADL